MPLSSGRRRTILVTGGTGTLGRELVARFAGVGDANVVVLARGVTSPSLDGLPGVRTIVGDVRRGATLGLPEADCIALWATITDIVHCAADTTFNRPLAESRATNVDGTRSVLGFAGECERLQRVACFSTVYVAGKTTGCFCEADVGGADGFVNSYEQSKAEMEDVVRDAMADLPVAIYRLSTIIGSSRTGEVHGLNAIHHALRLLYQGLAPLIPGHETTLVDLIPVDYAADAAHYLIERAFTPGATYHLCAGPPHSATLGEMLDATIDAFGRYRPAWRKRSIARPAIVELPTYELFVRSVEEAGNEILLQATRAVQAFAYQLAYPKIFDAGVADAVLGPARIQPPPVLHYYDRVVRWCVETNWGSPT